MKKNKICYILPFFDPNTDTHYYHLYDFIEKAALEMDIFLIVEKAPKDISFFKNVKKIEFQKLPLPFRIFENAYLILKARLLGYKKFYIHYSFLSAVNSSIIVKLLGGDNWYWSCGMMWLFKENKLNQLQWKITFKLVRHLVTGTHSIAEGYARNYNIPLKKIKIMPNWIDFSRFDQPFDRNKIYHKFSMDRNKKYVLFAHRLAPRKGAHYIVPIAREFEERIVFLIAGDGPYKSMLEKEVRDNNLKNVKILGKISNRLIPELMSVSDIFLMPSEEEGFPRVLIEAMASGLPFVASDIGGVREISPKIEQPYIYQVGDIAGYCDGIRKILETGNDYFKESLISESKKYDQKKVLKIFIDLFSN